MSLQIKELMNSLEAYYPNAEKTEQIIIDYALSSTGANVIGGILSSVAGGTPSLTIYIAILACLESFLTMYVKLCDVLEISLSQNTLKLIARAAVSKIAANLSGAISALFIFPGAIPIVSILGISCTPFVAVTVFFITVYLAGIIFLQLILKLAAKSSDSHSFSDISVSDMERETKNVTVTRDDMMKAIAAYNVNNRSRLRE